MYGLSKGFSNLPFSEEASDFLKLEIDQSKANPDFNKNAEEMFKAFRAEREGLISPARAGELFSNIVWVLPVLQGTAGGFTRLKEATKKITSAVRQLPHYFSHLPHFFPEEEYPFLLSASDYCLFNYKNIQARANRWPVTAY